MVNIRNVILLLALILLAQSPVRAQLADSLAQEEIGQATVLGIPLDGVVIGGGIATYQGELDRNPYRSLSSYLLNGGMDMLLSVERTYEGSFFQGNFRYTYVKGGDQYVEGYSSCCGFSNSVLGTNILSGFRMSILGRPDMLRMFMGLGLIRHQPINKNPDMLEELDVETLDEPDGIWAFTVPVGITVLRTFRITGRLVMSDYLDGAASGRPYDFMIHINATRPFSLGQ